VKVATMTVEELGKRIWLYPFDSERDQAEECIAELAKRARERDEALFAVTRLYEQARDFANAEKHCAYCGMDWDSYVSETFPHERLCPLRDIEHVLAGEPLAEAAIDAEVKL
jgi:hypothetical protein